MTVEQTPPPLPKLSFGTTIGTAHRHVLGNLRRFAKLAAIPFLLTLGLSILKIPTPLIRPVSDLVFIVLDLIPFTLLGVALSRVVLTETQAGFLPQPLVGRRTLTYLGYQLLLLLALLILAMLVVFSMGAAIALNPGEAQVGFGPWLGGLVGFFGFLLLLYVAARLSLVFPAVSVDQKLGLRGSWRLTRGSGLTLCGVFLAILLLILLAVVVGSTILGQSISINIGGGADLVIAPGDSLWDIVIDNAPPMIWAALVSYAGFGLLTAAYASAYAQLSGWGGPRADILERFE